MDADLKDFAVQWLRVAAMGILPVILTAFVSIPLALERHPGETVVSAERIQRHMT
ncbi:MAG TPA: hypothetical protein VFK10_05185 [Burkholderiaceae bacterium]|nr:hypothetical protein [Burkholderiaceae bacterium]